MKISPLLLVWGDVPFKLFGGQRKTNLDDLHLLVIRDFQLAVRWLRQTDAGSMFHLVTV